MPNPTHTLDKYISDNHLMSLMSSFKFENDDNGMV